MMDHPLSNECLHGQACKCDKGKIPTVYPFSFLAHLLIHIKETGISQGIQWSLMVHHSMPTKTEYPNTHRQPVQTVKHLTHFSLFRKLTSSDKLQEVERLKSWKVDKCTGLDYLKVVLQSAPSSKEKPIKPLAPNHSPLSSVCPCSTKLDVCMKTRPVF